MMIIAVLWDLGVFQPQGQRGKKHRMQMWMKMHQMGSTVEGKVSGEWIAPSSGIF